MFHYLSRVTGRYLVVASIITGAMALSSCTTPSGQRIEPKILAFDFEVSVVANPASRVAAIAGGASVTDFMSPAPCKFLASFAGARAPSINVRGAAGQPGFNFQIIATNPVNVATGGPANCGTVEEFELFVGSGNTTLSVGQNTNVTAFSVTIDGQSYSTRTGYFNASLGLFRPQTNYAVGNFQFVGNGGGGLIVTGEGSYATD